MDNNIIKIIEERIGYSFSNKDFIELAFTHKSSNPDYNYERLEFLGDAIIGAIVSEYLYLSFEKLSEGELSKIRAYLVNLDSLYKAACRIGVTEFIITEGIEERNKRIIGNVYEAIIGAIFLDSSYTGAKEILMSHLDLSGHNSPSNLNIKANMSADQIFKQNDYKSNLQEIIQKQYNTVPKYVTIKKEGPDHRSVFTVCVKFNNDILGYGIGYSKKIAEQIAAEAALKKLNNSQTHDKKK